MGVSWRMLVDEPDLYLSFQPKACMWPAGLHGAQFYIHQDIAEHLPSLAFMAVNQVQCSYSTVTRAVCRTLLHSYQRESKLL